MPRVSILPHRMGGTMLSASWVGEMAAKLRLLISAQIRNASVSNTAACFLSAPSLKWWGCELAPALKKRSCYSLCLRLITVYKWSCSLVLQRSYLDGDNVPLGAPFCSFSFIHPCAAWCCVTPGAAEGQRSLSSSRLLLASLMEACGAPC